MLAANLQTASGSFISTSLQLWVSLLSFLGMIISVWMAYKVREVLNEKDGVVDSINEIRRDITRIETQTKHNDERLTRLERWRDFRGRT